MHGKKTCEWKLFFIMKNCEDYKNGSYKYANTGAASIYTFGGSLGRNGYWEVLGQREPGIEK